MEVRYLLLARYAEQAPDGTHTIVGGGWDVQAVPTLPFEIPFIVVVAKVALDRADLVRPHVVQLRVLNPQGETFFVSEETDVPPQVLPPDRDNVIINISLTFHQVTFYGDGVYRFQVLCDDELARETPFRLEVADGPPSPGGRSN